MIATTTGRSVRGLSSLCGVTLSLFLLTACANSRDPETSELRSGMGEQFDVVRAQLVESGATRQQLREFDHARREMDRQMRHLERQMQQMAE